MIYEEGIRKHYKYIIGGGSQFVDVKTKLITEEERKKYIDLVTNIESCNITTTGSVYFQKQAVFPRAELKKIVSNPVTRKIERSEYVILNKEYCLRTLNRAYTGNWIKSNPSDAYWVPGYNSITIRRFLDTSDPKSFEEVLTLIDNCEGKKIVLDDELNTLVPRELDIKGDLYNKLNKMLGSGDLNTIKVGVQLLSNLNYNEYEGEILLLLNQNIQNIRGHKCGTTVAFKSLIKTVERDYSSWDTGDKLTFILNLVQKKQNSPTTIKCINDYFNEVAPLTQGQSYQITIIDTLIREKIEQDGMEIQE